MKKKKGSYCLEIEVRELPKLPNQLLGQKWFIRSRHASRWKALIGTQVMGLIPEQPLAKAKLTLTRISSREPDYDGLVGSFKAVIDALVDCRVLSGDTMKIIGKPTYDWIKGSPKQGMIRVKVEQDE